MNKDPTVKTGLEKKTNIKVKEGVLLEITEDAIFELIRDIKDPEHSFSLEELDVVKREYVKIEEINYNGVGIDVGFPLKFINIIFKPTIPHCSMAGIIGLSIKLVVQRFTKGHEIKVNILENTHTNWELISKQLNDKDRVQAASENASLMSVIQECTATVTNRYLL